MDLHIIIVIACVFLASLISLLFIHKFFRGKTFEEVAAEKRLLAEKLYGTKSKKSGSNTKRSTNQNVTKPHKRKNSNPKTSSNSGTSASKPEPAVEEETDSESLSTVEDNPPKVQEVQAKRNIKEEVVESVKVQKAPSKESKKSNKQAKKETAPVAVKEVVEKAEIAEMTAGQSKESKQPDEKLARHVDSPKIQNKPPKPKKKTESAPVSAAAASAKKDYPIPTVTSIMSILGRAEFTRNEIQILIDYLLNKQQDTTANHSEWSDDIVQKLRKKLEEKEKAIEEEQATTAGIQAKLRELRTTINTERVQHNAALKSHFEEVQSLKSELQNSTQDMNDRMEKLKEQYNALKSQSERFNPHLLLAQINFLNQFNDNAKRSTFVNQIIEILQPQNDELLQLKNENMSLHNELLLSNNQHKSLMINFNDIENKLISLQKELDEERANSQMQINNFQSALESAKSEIVVLQTNSQNNVHSMSTQLDELNNQLGATKTETNDLRNTLNTYKAIIQEKDQKIAEFEANIRNLVNKEDLLMKQLQEQKEKNNQPVAMQSNQLLSHEDKVRDLLKRHFPDAVSSSAGAALSLSFDQYVEQVISTHNNEIAKKHQAELKISEQKQQQLKQQLEHNNVSKTTTTTTTTNTTPTNDHYNTTSNHNESINNHKVHSNNGSSDDVILENAQLRAQVAELKSVVINTENTLKHLEQQAQEQESKWRNVVKLKQDEIDTLKSLNGEAV